MARCSTGGVTHFALEDVGIMRLQPGLTVVAPADASQTCAAVAATSRLPGPVYLRLGKGADSIDGLDGRFRIGKLELLGEGTEVAILTYGSITSEAVAAAGILRSHGVATTVAVAGCLAPSPSEDIADLLGGARLAVTVEAHYATGGLGSLVAETVAGLGLACRVVRCGITTLPTGATGDAGYLYEQHGVSAGQVAKAALDALATAC